MSALAARAAVSGPRHEAGQMPLASDLGALAWVSEQYGARLDHLDLLLGHHRRSTQRLVRRLREAGLIEARPVLADHPAWVWLTPAGQRLAGTGFRVWRPRVGLLAHVAAVNEVRLHIDRLAPAAEWVCERELGRTARRGEHLPDAVIALDGQRHAVEVELTQKSQPRMIQILDDLSDRFDALVYFCAPAARRQLERLAAGGEWPKLHLRELPPLGGAR
ncbi:MAG: hypothetical protein E6G56_08675 [Actinobacteria bacterium]|nr:MAG: hypothetical protein E6G56_08675 [Actinomycetota bacterium]